MGLSAAKCRTVMILGAVGLLGTIILRWGIVDPLIHAELAKKIRLEPGTEVWNIWTDIPIPIFMRFYFFNVTNAEEVTRGAKPILEEVGPYVYEEKRRKIILSVSDELVKYRPKTFYYFRPELSYGSQEDNITMLNVPFVALTRMAWDLTKEPFILQTLDEMLTEKGERLFHTHKVAEYLFDGVSIENFMELLTLPIPDAIKADPDFNLVIPKRLLDGDFGFFDDKNGTADDVWIVKTGKDANANFGKTLSWNNLTKLTAWKDERCNVIQGTDGTIFPPFADKSSILQAFSPDLCRSAEMVYEKESEFLGIPTLRFQFHPRLFGSVKDHPENDCFCKNSWDYCEKGGVLSLAPCIGGAPVFGSHPHFHEAHPDFAAAVEGLTPKGDYHSYVDVEPHIGLPIRGTLRLQINVELEAYDSIETFQNVPHLLFPLLWAEETATVTEELAAPIKLLVRGLGVMDVLAGGFCVVCAVAILGAFVATILGKRQGELFSNK